MSERVGLGLLFGLYALLGLSYSILVPPWEAPDEIAHYEVALYVAREGEFPPLRYNREAHQPPLFYWLASWPLRLLDHIDPVLSDAFRPSHGRFPSIPIWHWHPGNYRFMLGVRVLRWLNLLIGGLSLYLVYGAARRFAPQASSVALTTVSLVALLPQFLHIMAAVNNDPLATLAGAFLFSSLSRVCTEELGGRDHALLAGAALVLPPLVKLTVIPIAAAVFLAVVWRTRTHWRRHWRPLAGGATLTVGAAVALVSFGPPRAVDLWRSVVLRLTYFRPEALDWLAEWAPSFGQTYWGIVSGLSIGLSTTIVFQLTGLAALGWVGNVRLFLPGWSDMNRRQRRFSLVALGASVLLVAALNSWYLNLWLVIAVLCLYRSFRRPGDLALGEKKHWAMVWLVFGLAILVLAKNYLATPSTQGRFLFPSTGAISLLMASGWFALLPPRIARVLPYLTVGTMLALNYFLLIWGVVRLYYQPFLGD